MANCSPVDTYHLLFKNLPADVDVELLENFVECTADLCVVKLTYDSMVDPSMCVVKFDEDMSGEMFYELMKKVKAETLCGKVIVPLRLAKSVKILVHDNEETEKDLEGYFSQQPVSGGNLVARVTLLLDIAKAIVEFKNSSAVEVILQKDHALNSKMLHIEIYWEDYHSIIFKKSLENSSKLQIEPKDIAMDTQNTTNDPIKVVDELYKTSNRPKQTVQDISEATDEARDSGRQTSEATDEARECGNETNEATDEARDSGKETNEATDEARDSGKETNEATDEARDSGKETNEATDEARDSGKETNEATDEARDSGRQTNEATSGKNQNMDRATNDPKESTNQTYKAPESREILGMNHKVKEFSPSKLQLFLVSGSCKNVSTNSCHVEFDVQNSKVTFSGQESDIDNGIAEFLEISSKIEEVSEYLAPEMARAYRIPGVQNHLQKHCKDNSIGHFLSDDGQLSVATFKHGQAEHHLKQMLHQLAVKDINLSESLDDLADLSDFIKSLEENDKIHIEVKKEHKIVQVVGLKSEVTGTVEQIKAYLSDSDLEEKRYPVDGLVYRYILRFFDKNWKTLESSLREQKGSIEMDSDQLKIRVPKKAMDIVDALVSDFIQQISCFNVEVPENITSTKLWKRKENSEEFQRWLKRIEQLYRCCLELQIRETSGKPKSSFKAAIEQIPRFFSKVSRSHGRPKSTRQQTASMSRDLAQFVEVKSGDITKEVADVLVNVINKDLTLNIKGLSQSFLQAGGDELQQKLLSKREEHKHIVIVEATGDLLNYTKWIANIIIPRYKADNSSKVIRNRVSECLSAVKQMGLSSIAFPTLGCGLLRYPVNEVAHQMFSAICDFLQNSQTSLMVKIVVFESKHLETFKSELNKSISLKTPEVDDDGGEIQTVDDLELSSREAEPSEPQGALSAASYGPVVQTNQTYYLKVASLTENVKDLQKDILKCVKEEYYIKVIELFSSQKKAFHKLLKDHTLSSIGKQLNVDMRVDMERHMIQLCGEVKDALLASNQILQAIASTQQDDSPNLPAYWPPSKETNARLPIHHSDPLYKVIEELITKTWLSQFTGHGRDAAGINTSSVIEVREIHININKDLYAEYVNRHKSLSKKWESSKYSKFNAKPISTEMHLSPALTKVLNSDINECFLLHGTKQRTVNVICKTGFDFRVGQETGMFGRGVYFAESSSKADQYADEKGQRSDGKGLKMILSRVAMGNIYSCSDLNPVKFLRPPCTECLQDSCISHTTFYDSIVFDNPQKNFREFIIYDFHQGYPEFVITYDRV